MRAFVFNSVILAAIVVSSFLAVVAQPAELKPSAGNAFVGEILRYDATFKKILKGITVAELTMSAAKMPNGSDLSLKADAVSKGTLLKIFRFSFLQQYDSTLDPSFRILKSTKHDVQKDRVRDSEAVFDYGQKRVSYTETDPKDVSRPPRRIASEIGDHVLDILSAVYYLRLIPLAVGKKYELSVSDSGLVYRVPVTVTARELQKTILGNVWCYRVEPDVFGPGRLIEQKGSMIIWMADDARHTPVRSQINAEVGKIDIKLKSATAAK